MYNNSDVVYLLFCFNLSRVQYTSLTEIVYLLTPYMITFIPINANFRVHFSRICLCIDRRFSKFSKWFLIKKMFGNHWHRHFNVIVRKRDA